VLVGAGEAVLTALTLRALLVARPDLVRAARLLPRRPHGDGLAAGEP
jgi:hypothetical protein